MKRRAHGQQFRPLRAALVGQPGRTFDSCGVPRDHDLFGRIDIRRLTNFAVRAFLADLGNFSEFHAEDCRHGAHAHRHRLLHVFAAVAHRANRIGKSHRARRHVGGILSQAVTRNIGRLRKLTLDHPQSRNRCRKDGGLRDLRQAQLLLRALEAHLRELIAQGIVGLCKRLAGDGIFLGQVFAHAHGL